MRERNEWPTGCSRRIFVPKPQLMVVKQVTEQPPVFLACFWINYLGAWPSRVSWSAEKEAQWGSGRLMALLSQQCTLCDHGILLASESKELFDCSARNSFHSLYQPVCWFKFFSCNTTVCGVVVGGGGVKSASWLTIKEKIKMGTVGQRMKYWKLLKMRV